MINSSRNFSSDLPGNLSGNLSRNLSGNLSGDGESSGPSQLSFRAVKMLNTAEGRRPLDLSFQLQAGRLLTLYGPSGAGKTTILRMLAGLTTPDSGHIKMDGEIWYDAASKIHLPARKRSVGLVFQDFALFPHLTVRQQLEFALQKGQDPSIIHELLSFMELENLQDIRPLHLSGGQQQRVALARAITRRPRLLLLDEPLSALDDEMRYRLQDYILRAHRHFNLTTILVSHYLPEIFRLSDEVIYIEKGSILRRGAPSAIFEEEKISGKFKLTGEIVDIVPADIVFIVSILSANTIVKVIATADEVAALRPGQKVLVASKAFNPVIIPLA